MLKLALTIVQELCYRINIPAPAALAAATGPGDLQLKHTLYDVCEELRREGPFRPQIMTHTFSTANAVATYPLPGDYYAAASYTHYNQDTGLRLIGPLSDAEFMDYSEGMAPTPGEFAWRIIGFDENSASTLNRQIELYPTPTGVEDLTFAYVTGHLFIPQKWTAGTAYTASTSFCNVNGKIYQCATNITAADTAPSGTGAGIVDDDGTWDYFNASYETMRVDTDYCMFDGDVVKLGLRAKYLKDNDGSELLQQAVQAEYRRAKRSLSYRWEGQSRARGDRRVAGGIHSPYVQPQSWSWV
jgi:hypothetical protein